MTSISSGFRNSGLYDEELLSKVIRFHGFQLTVALRESFGVDLNTIIREQITSKGNQQKIIRGITGDEVCKSIHEFIAKHAEDLYGHFPKENPVQTGGELPIPSLEMYVDKTVESRKRYFVKTVEEGDILYGVITSKSGAGQLEIHVLCSEGESYMNTSMLNILGTVAVPDNLQSKEAFYVDDIVRCAVYNKLKKPNIRICFDLALDNFQFANRQKKPSSPLGKINFEELPAKFRATHMMNGSEDLKVVVEKYVNSKDFEESLVAQKFGVEDKPSSFMATLRKEIKPMEKASAISRLQMECWSAQVTKDGKNLMPKDGKMALDCFDMALKFNPFNADAIYLKGLLFEKDGKAEEALPLYRRCLAIEPNHELAKAAMDSALRMKHTNRVFIGRARSLLSKEENATSLSSADFRREQKRQETSTNTVSRGNEDVEAKGKERERRDRFGRDYSDANEIAGNRDRVRNRAPERRDDRRRNVRERSPDRRIDSRGKRTNVREQSPDRRMDYGSRRERSPDRRWDSRGNFRERSPDRRRERSPDRRRERRDGFQRKSPDSRADFRDRNPDRRDRYQRKSPESRESYGKRHMDERNDIRTRDSGSVGYDRRVIEEDMPNRALGQSVVGSVDGRDNSQRIGDDRDKRFGDRWTDAQNDWNQVSGRWKRRPASEYAKENVHDEDSSKIRRFEEDLHDSEKQTSRRIELHDGMSSAADEGVYNSTGDRVTEHEVTVRNDQAPPKQDFVFKVPTLPVRKPRGRARGARIS